MKKRYIVMLSACAALIVMLHGYINIMVSCRGTDKGFVYCDLMRNFDTDADRLKRVYYTDTKPNGVAYIAGLDESALKDIVYGKMCKELMGAARPSVLFKKAVPGKAYDETYKVYKSILQDVRYFPVPADVNGKVDTPYADSWNESRSYGGDRLHEGTDIMAGNNVRGYFPVVSMTDGIVEKMGWLELGGYRIGIRSPGGAYYYYAHLDRYADGIKEGDAVKAGTVIGTMGDSGYGEEGTVGRFDVHLHIGIYVKDGDNEISYNPYYILKAVEGFRMEFLK